MTYEEFTQQLDRAGIKVREFATLIKRTPNAITNYASKGEVPALIAIVATFIAEMNTRGVDYRAIISDIDFHGIKPREDGVKGFRGKKNEADNKQDDQTFLDHPIPY